MSEVSTEIINFTNFIVLPFYINICIMLNAYFVKIFYYVIYCTIQHHRILLYKYGVIEINKHLHLPFNMCIASERHKAMAIGEIRPS